MRRPGVTGGLLARFLLTLGPAFLLVAVPASLGVLSLLQRSAEDDLAARVGTQAARVAAALERHDAAMTPALTRDVVASLASDPSFVCAAATRGAETVTVPASGRCEGTGHAVTLPYGEGGTLTLRYTTAPLDRQGAFAVTLTAAILAVSLIVALGVGSMVFGRLVGRRLARLNAAIDRRRVEAEWTPVGDEGADALARVAQAFDALAAVDAERERALTDLNRTLEARVAERTVALREALALAEAGSEAKSRFLMAVSHELRTPLNGMMGLTEVVAAQLPQDAPQREPLALVARSGERLLRLIDSVLLFTDLDEAAPLRTERATARAVLSPLASGHEASGMALRLVGDALDAPLHADRDKLAAALGAVLHNAIAFSPEGAPVTVGAWRGDRAGVRLTVTDEGQGMDPADVPLALEPFRQLDGATTRTHEGVGLGLALAARVAERHGGALTVETAPGEGTTVTLTLPGADALAEAA